MQTSESNKLLVEAFFDALNRGDVDYIVNAYASDGCVQTMGHTLISGVFSRDQTYSNDYHFLFEFCDGKLLKLKEYMDTERVTDVLCAGQRPPPDQQ